LLFSGKRSRNPEKDSEGARRGEKGGIVSSSEGKGVSSLSLKREGKEGGLRKGHIRKITLLRLMPLSEK